MEEIDIEWCKQHGMAFVLVKYSVHIIKEIKLDEEIVIKTYPRQVRGAAFIRDFIAEINGETYMAIVSGCSNEDERYKSAIKLFNSVSSI